MGKGALFARRAHADAVTVGTLSLSSGPPKAGPGGFAYATLRRFDRNPL
jgi:hypothetical protein